jgi:hypothetical protein
MPREAVLSRNVATETRSVFMRLGPILHILGEILLGHLLEHNSVSSPRRLPGHHLLSDTVPSSTSKASQVLSIPDHRQFPKFTNQGI